MPEQPKTPLRGKALLAAAVNQIIQHPETWKQSQWHCRTSHCIGGWCQVLAGLPESNEAYQEVPQLIGLSLSDADWLFAPERSLTEIHHFAHAFINDQIGKPLPPLVVPE